MTRNIYIHSHTSIGVKMYWLCHNRIYDDDGITINLRDRTAITSRLKYNHSISLVQNDIWTRTQRHICFTMTHVFQTHPHAKTINRGSQSGERYFQKHSSLTVVIIGERNERLLNSSHVVGDGSRTHNSHILFAQR